MNPHVCILSPIRIDSKYKVCRGLVLCSFLKSLVEKCTGSSQPMTTNGTRTSVTQLSLSKLHLILGSFCCGHQTKYMVVKWIWLSPLILLVRSLLRSLQMAMWPQGAKTILNTCPLPSLKFRPHDYRNAVVERGVRTSHVTFFQNCHNVKQSLNKWF